MDLITVREVLCRIDNRFSIDSITFESFKSPEDGHPYEAWLVEFQSKKYVLKKAKKYELDIYSTFFKRKINGVPQYLGSTEYDGNHYLLTDYIEGDALLRCDRESIIKVLNTLICLQNEFWQADSYKNVGLNFEKSLDGRISRGKYLNDAELETVYNKYLQEYFRLPRTLCHDDLLPFNILIAEEATIIDWELAGLLPYITSFARFIAHTEDSSDAFFYMNDEDKSFAVEYYYREFVSGKSIAYNDYIRSLKLFLFYEYCEWIMLGNKYDDADMERYEAYFRKAKNIMKDI